MTCITGFLFADPLLGTPANKWRSEGELTPLAGADTGGALGAGSPAIK